MIHISLRVTQDRVEITRHITYGSAIRCIGNHKGKIWSILPKEARNIKPGETPNIKPNFEQEAKGVHTHVAENI